MARPTRQTPARDLNARSTATRRRKSSPLARLTVEQLTGARHGSGKENGNTTRHPGAGVMGKNYRATVRGLGLKWRNHTVSAGHAADPHDQGRFMLGRRGKGQRTLTMRLNHRRGWSRSEAPCRTGIGSTGQDRGPRPKGDRNRARAGFTRSVSKAVRCRCNAARPSADLFAHPRHRRGGCPIWQVPVADTIFSR